MEHKKLIEYLLLVSITGSGGLVVAHISKMSDNLQKITISVQELNSRIELLTHKTFEATDQIKDHEYRLRKLENVK